MGFTVLGIGIGLHLVPVRLSCLGKQDERRGIGGLKTEGEIEQDKRINIESGESCSIDPNPKGNHYRLGDKKNRGSEKSGKRLGLEGEPVISEHRAEMQKKTNRGRIRGLRQKRLGTGLRYSTNNVPFLSS